MDKVFVYGTLKSTHNGGYYFKSPPTITRTKEKFILTGDYSFPRAVPVTDDRIRDTDPHGYVVGELYEVDDAILSRLDSYEGYPTFYSRQVIETEHGEAMMYIAQDAYDPRMEKLTPDEEGNLIWGVS